MLTGSQIRAARGLLGWTLADLAKRTGLQNNTISFFENGKGRTEFESIEKMVRALEQEGVEFTTTGVQLVTPIYFFRGENCYADLLADVLAVESEEILIENVANRKSPKAVLDQFKELRKKGVHIRMTAEEGDTHLVLPISCYRWVPEKYFKNWVTVTYADRVATKTRGKEPGYIVIRDKDMAEASRNRFNMVWDMLKPLNIESTAHDRIK